MGSVRRQDTLETRIFWCPTYDDLVKVFGIEYTEANFCKRTTSPNNVCAIIRGHVLNKIDPIPEDYVKADLAGAIEFLKRVKEASIDRV